MKPTPLCGQTVVAPGGSSVSPSSPRVRRGWRTRAVQESSELPPSGSLGQRTWGRVLTLTYPRFSLRTAFPVHWGKPLWGSRCFPVPGSTPRVWAGACSGRPRQGFSARGMRVPGTWEVFGERVRSGRRQLYTGTLTNKSGLFPAFHLFFEKLNNSPLYQNGLFQTS